MKIAGIPYIQGRNSYADSDGTKHGIAIHNTSNDATAAAEASYATRRTDGVSAHFFIDADSAIQSLDTAASAGHAGSYEGNQHAIAVEITGTNGKSRQWWMDNVAWDLLGRILADVCRAYGIPVRRCTVAEMRANPRINGFYSHDDMRRAWGGTTHTDPGPNFPWDRLLAAVSKHMDGKASAGEGGSMIGLRKGDKGERVGGLQEALRQAGFDPGPTDSDYGPKTAAALLACRKAQGSSASNGNHVDSWAYGQILRAIARRHAGHDGKPGPAGPPGPTGPAGDAAVLPAGAVLRIQ